MISSAEGGGRGSSSFRFRTRSRFRRTALRVPPDILCDKNQQSEQVVRWNQRQEGHDEGGKDYNAKAMIQETQNKSGSITATPGWKTRQPRGDWTKLPQGTQKLETLDNHNNP